MLFLPNSAGIAMTSEATETAITALNGTLSLFTRRKIAHPGIPRSREKAYHVREALVSPAAPQKSWPIVAMIRTIFAAHGVERARENRADEPGPIVDGLDVVRGEQERKQDEPADQRGEEDRAPHALRRS